MNDIGTCRESCPAYEITEPKGCFQNLFCAKQQRCTGRLFDCQFYHADAWVCMSQDPKRKYDWIEYEDGRILGHKQQCASMYILYLSEFKSYLNITRSYFQILLHKSSKNLNKRRIEKC